MAELQIGALRVSADAVIFDKDGTLLALDPLWAGRALRWIDAALAQAGGDGALRAELQRLIGVDALRRRVVADGALAVATLDKLYTLLAGVLVRRGMAWQAAEALAQTSGRATLGAPPLAGEVQPLGVVQPTLQQLRAAGVRLALLTSDDRAGSERCLALLGIADLFDSIICADDGWPHKPDPAGVLALCVQLGVAPQRVVLVGDARSDMLAGRVAGVAACVGIAPTGDAGRLADLAACVVPSVAALRLVGS